MRYRVVFDEMKLTFVKHFTCLCGRNLRRQKTFSQTYNPYNVVADRSRPKTREEVAAAVRAEGLAWRAAPEPCLHAGEPDMNVRRSP